MGSESLSHKFAIEDPTYKEHASSSKHKDDKSSSNHSMSHTSGTQPVSMSNGPKSSPSASSSSSSSKIQHKPKTNSKYEKLIKLYSQQLSHIGTTLNAIESLSTSANNNQNQTVLLNKKRVDELNKDLENLRNTPSNQDHTHFDPLKNDIEQLINDLKSYKMNTNDPASKNTVDYLVGLPLDVSDSENDEDKTLLYF